MPTGSFEGNTARDVADPDRRGGALVNHVNYKALWGLLLFGWIVSYADRTLTGPVVAWMIQNKAGFIGDSANPAALGGLVGSMFFLGYMLTQYPGGRLGDRFGHREMIIVSLLWAAVLTAVSGLVAGLVAFVAARVLTGLGEGVFYSNDRTLIMNHTPVAKRTLGLGVVIAGLSIGLTVGIIATPLLIGWGTSMGMGGEAWRVPFFAFAVFTLDRRRGRVRVLPRQARRGDAADAALPAPHRLLGAHVRRDRGAVPAGRDAALAGVADRARSRG